MRFNAVLLLTVLTLTVVSSGCSRSEEKEPTAKPTLTPDPKTSFDDVSTKFTTELRKLMPFDPAAQVSFTFDHHSINVMKTDSLTTPYTATLTQPILANMRLNEADARSAGTNELLVKYVCTFRFGWSDGKWEFRSAQAARNLVAFPDKIRQVELLDEKDGDIGLRVQRARTAAGL